MKRKLIVLFATIAFLAGFGAMLHSPSSIMDAVTGATPKSKKAAQEAAQMEEIYILGVNSHAGDGLDEGLREIIKKAAAGEENLILSDDRQRQLSVYVLKTDKALLEYAHTLADKLEKAGVHVKIKAFGETMLRSRIVSEKYQMFLASNDILEMEELKQIDYSLVNSEKMGGAGA